MIEIKDLLTRWNNVLLFGESKKETIRGIISAVIGVNIDSDNIKISNNTVFLDIKPIYKSEILLKRAKIDLLLEEAFNQKNLPDIR